MNELPAQERIILAIDTSRQQAAERLATIAHEAGARYVKLGLELSSATSWHYCAELAASHDLDWIADAKLDDIPNTVVSTVRNIKNLDHPPFGITLHTTTGVETMYAAKEEAETIKMFGVTVLTSISETVAENLYHVSLRRKVMELARDAATAGISGVVSSPLEVGMIKRDLRTRKLLTMIPGTRSETIERADQARVGTPAVAIRDGADLLVIGRQITQAEDPAQAYEMLVAEVEGAV